MEIACCGDAAHLIASAYGSGEVLRSAGTVCTPFVVAVMRLSQWLETSFSLGLQHAALIGTERHSHTECSEVEVAQYQGLALFHKR
eukprot:1918900-Amphidinium_carterae.1